ncbi:hypothetical protein DMENIID0001_084510 [Sergentomyia squamirostris]
MENDQGSSSSSSSLTPSIAKRIEGRCMQFEDDYDPSKDVFFSIGNDLIMARKSKLGHKSEVFKAQFASGIEGKRINIPDISFEIFYLLIRNIYDYEIQVTPENFMEIFYASRKYFVHDLTTKVVLFVLGFIQAINLAEYFDELEKFDIKTITDHIISLCGRFPIHVIRTLKWTVKSHKTILKIILESPIINCPEFHVYREMMQMIENTCGNQNWLDVQKEFGTMIHLVRFPTMSVTEVIKCGKPPTFLTAKQAFDIVLWIQERAFTETLQFFSAMPRFQSSDYCNFCHRRCLNCRGKVGVQCTCCPSMY